MKIWKDITCTDYACICLSIMLNITLFVIYYYVLIVVLQVYKYASLYKSFDWTLEGGSVQVYVYLCAYINYCIIVGKAFLFIFTKLYIGYKKA